MSARVVGVNEHGMRVGEDHQHARLTDAEVELIRQLHDEGMSYAALAEKFGIGKTTVADICKFRRRGQTVARWKTIQEKSKLIDVTDYLDAEGLAVHLGYANLSAMTNMLGRLPPPDTVFRGKPYWHKDTAAELLEAQSRGIHAAFGGQKEI